MRNLAVALSVVLLPFMVGCPVAPPERAGATMPGPQWEQLGGDKGGPSVSPKGDGPRGAHEFGEQVRSGDLLISIPEVDSKQCAGQYGGRFTSINLLVVKLTIQNTSAGKIVDWPGWQGKATIEDEHGNKFRPADLRGWSCLPHNNTFGDGWDGDTGARIAPGTTHVNALYHEHAPPTSRSVILTVPLQGQTLRFRGRIGNKASLDREAALEAVKGKVLDAGGLFGDLKAGKANIETAYPIGGTIRASGVLRQKQDQTLSRPDLPQIPYLFIVSYEPDLPVNTDVRAICYTKDKALYNRLKVGERVSLQGTLTSIHRPAKSPSQVQLRDCVEAR